LSDADNIIDDILRREGSSFTDHPNDRGGPTRFGITQKAWMPYKLANKTHYRSLPLNVKDLTREQAVEFYRAMHVAPFEWIKDQELLALVVDCGVNHGVVRATKWLQLAAGCEVDGIIGPITRAAVNTAPRLVYVEVLRQRLRFYAKIATDQLPNDPDLPFLRGWINRACEFLR
jgi:lysozyme family protein